MKFTLNLPLQVRREMQVAAVLAGYANASEWLRDVIRRELAREPRPTATPQGPVG